MHPISAVPGGITLPNFDNVSARHHPQTARNYSQMFPAPHRMGRRDKAAAWLKVEVIHLMCANGFGG
jgi:hypothetical protein